MPLISQDNALTVNDQEFEPNYISFQYDSLFKIEYIRSGQAIHHHGADAYIVEKGDVLAVGPAIPHGYSVPPAQQLKVTAIRFDVQALGDTLSDPAIMAAVDRMIRGSFQNGRFSGLFRSVPHFVHSLIDQLADEFNNQTAGYKTASDALLKFVLVELYRGSKSFEVWEKHQTTGGKIIEVIPLIHTMAVSPTVSVSKIAQAAALSPGYFNRKFKQLMGETVSHYIQRIRVAKAMELLTTTSWKIEEIAFHVGYRDPDAFRTVFRRIVGSPPSDIRRRLDATGSFSMNDSFLPR